MANKKRKDGRIQKQVTIGRDYKTGKPIYEYVYGKSQSEVNTKVKEVKEKIIRGEIISSKSTLGDFADTWIDTAISKSRYNTYRMYAGIIKNQIKPTLGHLSISTIKPIQVQREITKLEESGKHRTADLMRLTLNQIFEAAIDNELCFRNPAKRTKKPQYKSKPVKPLTEIEIDALISAEIEPVARLFALLCLFQGLRKGEALARKRNEFDKLYVDEVIVEKKIKPAPKTIAGFRSLETLPAVKRAFRDIPQNTLYIFNEYGGSKPYQKLWGAIEQGFAEKIKPVVARRFTAHVLRHTFCTMLYYADFDILQMQYLMGHANPQVTMDIYTHIQTESLGKKDKYQKWKPVLRKYLLNESCQNPVNLNILKKAKAL